MYRNVGPFGHKNKRGPAKEGNCIAIALSALIIVLITVRTCRICYFPTHLTPFFTLCQNHSHPLSRERLSRCPVTSRQSPQSSVFLSSEPLGPLTWLLFSHSVVSYSLRPHGLQHVRLPWLSSTPGACSNSYPSSRWCHPTISFSHCLLLLPSVFPSI